MSNPTLNDLFDQSSPYFNGAINLPLPPSSKNVFTDGIDPKAIGDPQAAANITNVGLSVATVTLDSTDSIQKAIDYLATIGGGVIRLNAGTHTPPGNVTFPVKTPIQIVGVNMTSAIIDFGSADRRFILAGSNIYTTGTVSISSGVTVTGSSTGWLTSGLVAGDEIFLDSRWYKIDTIAGDTTIILAEGYGGTALSGATYRASSIVRDVEFTEITIKNSTSSSGAIDGDDCRNVLLEDITLVSNNVNISMTNFSEWNSQRTVSAAATGNGAAFTTGTFCNNYQFASVGNGAHAFVLNGLMSASFLFCAANGNTGDGFNITSCANLDVLVQANSNGGQGIELVSGNKNIKLNQCEASYNTSDGVKFTATSDYCKIIACHLELNGGYGVNIAASTCDYNHLALSTFLTNTSGNYNDSGTNTVLIGV